MFTFNEILQRIAKKFTHEIIHVRIMNDNEWHEGGVCVFALKSSKWKTV